MSPPPSQAAAPRASPDSRASSPARLLGRRPSSQVPRASSLPGCRPYRAGSICGGPPNRRPPPPRAHLHRRSSSAPVRGSGSRPWTDVAGATAGIAFPSSILASPWEPLGAVGPCLMRRGCCPPDLRCPSRPRATSCRPPGSRRDTPAVTPGHARTSPRGQPRASAQTCRGPGNSPHL